MVVASAAELDSVYKPILDRGDMLYTGRFDYFELSERGDHGRAIYSKLDSEPYYSSLTNSLRASIIPLFEVQLGYKETFPADYSRYTYDAIGVLDTYQEFNLKYFRDFNISGRLRQEPFEIWADYIRKKQKSDWNMALIPSPTNYFAYNRTRYNNVSGGIRYISASESGEEKSNLSILDRQLMDKGQANVEIGLEFEEGKVRRLTDYNLRGTLKYNYFHYLKPHFTPSLLARYGVCGNLELEAGAYYSMPFRYKYVYEMYNRNGTSNLVVGDYRLRNIFYFPLKCRYRPYDSIQLTASSDFKIANQRLSYWQKTAANAVSNYPSKELTYYNLQPALKVDYLYSAGKKIDEDKFSGSTRSLLKRSQFLAEVQLKKDITSMDKNRSNGDQNLIDIYNLFDYPIDFFVAGTEYANFLTGNYTRYAANVKDQDYYMIESSITYGITDSLNAGAKAGYRSGSSHENFTLHDMNSHRYKVSPYYYIGLLCNWRMTKNSMLSLSAHLVPEYTVQLWRTGDAKGFKAENNYLETSLSVNILY
ncbi:MAG: hypothetical protein JW800_00230 [Candidatus Omnitrophica bacterium]|nr:hypothetical protein [Candidatus Omnitrophota bacterium]